MIKEDRELLRIIEQGDLSASLLAHLKDLLDDIRFDLYNKWLQEEDNKKWESIKSEVKILNELINKINSNINYGKLAREELEGNKLTLDN